MQSAYNMVNDVAIDELKASVTELKMTLALLAEDPRAGNGHNERASKAPRTSSGKSGPEGSGSSRRAASAKPMHTSVLEVNTQRGNARVCHVILKDAEVIASRMQAATMQFVENTMPQLFAAGSRVDFRSRAKICKLTFASSGECSLFVNKVFCIDNPKLVFGAGTSSEIAYDIKCKHDESVESRRHKYIHTKLWRVLQEIFKEQAKGKDRLILKVDHLGCSISAELGGFMVKKIVNIVHAAGGFTIQGAAALSHIPGFDDTPIEENRLRMTDILGPQR
jgi:hypothetical protein